MKNKKLVVTIIALLVCFGAVMLTGCSKTTEDVATVVKDGKEITVDKDGNEVKVNKDGDVEIVEKNAVDKDKAKKAVNTSNSSKQNNSNYSNKNNSSSSSSPSSSNKKDDSNSSSTSKPTTHTHSWTAVYATKQVQVGTEYKCVDSIMCCVCGARDIDFAHINAHLDAGEPNNTWREYVYENVPVYETQQYIDYYKCSCGATK